MKALLLKRKGKFIQYLIASFLFNISHFLEMGLFALIMAGLEKKDLTFYRIVIIATVLAVIYSAVNFLISRIMRIGYMRDTILDVRNQAFEKITRMSYQEFSAKSKDVYISNLINDVNTFEEKFFISFLNFLIDGSMILACLIILLFVDFKLMFLMLPVSAILYGCGYLFSKRTVALQEEVSVKNEEFTTEISGTFQGLEILKLNNIEEKFLHKSVAAVKKLENRKFAFNMFTELQRNLIYTIGYVLMIFVLIYFCFALQDHQLALASASFLYMLCNRVIFSLAGIFPLWNTIKASAAIYRKITQPEAVSPAGSNVSAPENKASHPFSFRERIDVKDLSFSYENRVILDKATFTIEKGRKYLIKGVSGAGKSTLIKLLSKTYENYSGSILSDGTELRQIKDSSFQDKVAFIYQDVFLFEDSIRNNITLFRDLPEEQVLAAAKAGGVDAILKDQPDGLDTVLSENGKNLSGGQRQRISIARAIAKKSELLFVDEGTSSLNEELGRQIEQVFLSLPHTVLSISHRYYEGISEQYDYVLEIKNGRIDQYPAEEYFKEVLAC